MTVNVICMKWGHLYGPHYVNRLYAMTARHLSRPFRFVCLTDDASGLRPEVESFAIPKIRLDPPYEDKPWRKIGLYSEKIADLEGLTLFIDLDVVIIDSIDDFFEYPGDFCIIHNWTKRSEITGNSSVFRWEIGAQTHILETFESRPTQHWVDAYRNSQTFLSAQLGSERLTYWPDPWCVSFKKHCLRGGRLGAGFLPSRVPDGARIVVFHGHPNPDEALAGEWPGGWGKRLRPARWIAEHWREE